MTTAGTYSYDYVLSLPLFKEYNCLIIIYDIHNPECCQFPIFVTPQNLVGPFIY